MMKFSEQSVIEGVRTFFPDAEVVGIYDGVERAVGAPNRAYVNARSRREPRTPRAVGAPNRAYVNYLQRLVGAGAPSDQGVRVLLKTQHGGHTVETFLIGGLSYSGVPFLETQWYEASEALTWPDGTRILTASNPTHPIYAEFRKGPDFVDWVAAGYCRFIPLPEKLA